MNQNSLSKESLEEGQEQKDGTSQLEDRYAGSSNFEGKVAASGFAEQEGRQGARLWGCRWVPAAAVARRAAARARARARARRSSHSGTSPGKRAAPPLAAGARGPRINAAAATARRRWCDWSARPPVPRRHAAVVLRAWLDTSTRPHMLPLPGGARQAGRQSRPAGLQCL